MKSPNGRRLAICLCMALAVHAGLLAAVTQANLTPEPKDDRIITATLTVRGTTTQPVDSEVIASHAQRGSARRSQQATSARRTRQASQSHLVYAGSSRAGQPSRTTRKPMPRRLHVAGFQAIQYLKTQAAGLTIPRLIAPDNMPAFALSGTEPLARPNRSAQSKRAAAARAARADARARYLNAWRRRVEEYGNRHYPSELIDRAPRNRLTLVVTLRADGNVQSVRVSRSSGSAALDQAAADIVRGAAPYAPFPPALRKHHSRLTFAFEWVFG